MSAAEELAAMTERSFWNSIELADANELLCRRIAIEGFIKIYDQARALWGSSFRVEMKSHDAVVYRMAWRANSVSPVSEYASAVDLSRADGLAQMIRQASYCLESAITMHPSNSGR